MAKHDITLSYEEFAEMQRDLDWLSALESAGVDNWEGIDFAREIFNTFHKENDE